MINIWKFLDSALKKSVDLAVIESESNQIEGGSNLWVWWGTNQDSDGIWLDTDEDQQQLFMSDWNIFTKLIYLAISKLNHKFSIIVEVSVDDSQLSF